MVFFSVHMKDYQDIKAFFLILTHLTFSNITNSETSFSESWPP